LFDKGLFGDKQKSLDRIKHGVKKQGMLMANILTLFNLN